MKRFKPNKMIAVLIIAASFSANLYAAGMSSTSYAIKWDVADGGGGLSASPNYRVEASTGQPSASGESSSANYISVAGFEAVPDGDADTVRDIMDNCLKVSNTDQRDTDGDGYGNICDPDLDNNQIVNAADLALFKPRFFSADPDADFDGNGIVNAADLSILKAMFFKPPGPSGIVP